MMLGKKWLRLRSPGILPDQSVHQVQDYFFSHQRVTVNFGDAAGAETGALGKTTPVINIWNSDVVETAGNSVHFRVTHHRHVDYLGDLVRDDSRKMTDVARVLRIRKRH